MTFKPATEWPKGFTPKLETITGPVFGDKYLYGYFPISTPATAGPKPCNKYEKVAKGHILYVDRVFWIHRDTFAQIYEDPCGLSAQGYRQGTTLKLTGYICVKVFSRSYAARNGALGLNVNAIAYQVWSDDGLVDESNPNNLWLRRNGNFTDKSGRDWFVPMVTGYLPRKIGGKYTSVGDTILETGRDIFQDNPMAATVGTTYSSEDIAQAQAIAAGLALTFGASTVVSDPVNTGPTGPTGPTGNRRSNTPVVPSLPIPAITITTRMPRGYVGRAMGSTDRPQMVQRYRTDDNKHADETFIFRYIPQGIKYSGLSGNWVEVPRAEDIPFVDWASWQLMKVSFSFIIAADRTEPGGTVVPDGLDIPVDAEIEKLRRMAQRKVPVTLVNFDDMLTFQLRRGEKSTRGTTVYTGQNNTGVQTTQPNMEFVIQDLSVTATRRTSQQTVGESASMLSMISVAQCEITLTEIPVETVGIIALPPITSPALPPSKKKPPGPPNGQEVALFSPGLPNQDITYNGYIPPET